MSFLSAQAVCRSYSSSLSSKCLTIGRSQVVPAFSAGAGPCQERMLGGDVSKLRTPGLLGCPLVGLDSERKLPTSSCPTCERGFVKQARPSLFLAIQEHAESQAC